DCIPAVINGAAVNRCRTAATPAPAFLRQPLSCAGGAPASQPAGKNSVTRADVIGVFVGFPVTRTDAGQLESELQQRQPAPATLAHHSYQLYAGTGRGPVNRLHGHCAQRPSAFYQQRHSAQPAGTGLAGLRHSRYRSGDWIIDSVHPTGLSAERSAAVAGAWSG